MMVKSKQIETEKQGLLFCTLNHPAFAPAVEPCMSYVREEEVNSGLAQAVL